MEQNKKGGQRVGAGRKPIPILDKKSTFTFFFSGKDTLKFGGKEKLKEKVIEFVNKFGENNRQVIQDFTVPTNQIKPITDAKPTTNVVLSVQPKEMPLIEPKTVQEWIKEKRELQTQEQYEEWLQKLENDMFLTSKQKSAIKIS